VPPPVVDRWGPGLRVPAIIISPFAKKGFVDYTRTTPRRFWKLIAALNLQPLGDRDATRDLLTAFDFGQKA
jgi:phospholipase C